MPAFGLSLSRGLLSDSGVGRDLEALRFFAARAQGMPGSGLPTEPLNVTALNSERLRVLADSCGWGRALPPPRRGRGLPPPTRAVTSELRALPSSPLATAPAPRSGRHPRHITAANHTVNGRHQRHQQVVAISATPTQPRPSRSRHRHVALAANLTQPPPTHAPRPPNRNNKTLAGNLDQEWQRHTQINCIPGHGGAGFESAAPLPLRTASGCLQKCSGQPPCSAVVVERHRGRVTRCALRESVTLEACMKSPTHDVYVRRVSG